MGHIDGAAKGSDEDGSEGSGHPAIPRRLAVMEVKLCDGPGPYCRPAGGEASGSVVGVPVGGGDPTSQIDADTPVVRYDPPQPATRKLLARSSDKNAQP
jgi:hypothetical protein